MRTPLILLKAIGKAVLNFVEGGLLGDIVFEALPEIANNVWDEWSKEKTAAESRAELEAWPGPRARNSARGSRRSSRRSPPRAPADVRQGLNGYLRQVPATIHRALRRPDDPTGTTIPPGLELRKGEDLLRFLPTRLPRFKPGDRPVPSVDWVLDELLGVGGFGEIWKAHNPYVEGFEPVALKFCIDPLAQQRLLKHEA